MYIITEKEENRIVMMGKDLDYMENGYPRLINENVAFPVEMVNVHRVEYLPEDIEPERHCYTPEAGFFENPNWVEPNKYGIPDDLLRSIQDDTVADLIELGVIA